MVSVALVVGYAPVARTSSWDVVMMRFFFGPPARLTRGCPLDLDIIIGFRPATPPKEATYPFLEAPRIRRVLADADGFRCSLLCVTFCSAPRAFCGGGLVVFEKPEDGDAADDHDEGERYDEHPKADWRSSKLGHLKRIRCLIWQGCQCGLGGDRTRG